MKKIDALTAGAVGFAAFAAWYVLRKPSAAAGQTAAQSIYDTWANQRHAVGNSLGQNLQSMNGALGLLPSTVNSTTSGNGLGLQGPQVGFWA